MLRLVHPAPKADATAAPRRKHRPARAYSLKPEETRHLRVAIKNTARAYGGMDVLAQVMEVAPKSLRQVAYGVVPGSAAMALLVARAAGMSVEALLGGVLSPTGRCPTCGARAAAQRPERGARAPGQKPEGGAPADADDPEGAS